MNDDLMWFDPQMMGEDDPSKMPDHVWERLQKVIANEQSKRERG
jgi:hypothetical protein